MKSFVFNGWAAEASVWDLCAFRRDRLFDYVEQLDGLPERAVDETDAFVLVGFSMGGATALRMLLRRPERTKGLVLVSATARMMEEKTSGWAGMSLRRRAALKLGTQMMHEDDPSPLFAEAALDRGLDYLQEVDVREELVARAAEFASIPVAIFQSERDYIVRPHNAGFLKRVFPQATLTMVDGAEHTLPRAIPALIDRAVDAMAGSGERKSTDKGEEKAR